MSLRYPVNAIQIGQKKCLSQGPSRKAFVTHPEPVSADPIARSIAGTYGTTELESIIPQFGSLSIFILLIMFEFGHLCLDKAHFL
jgi:hypothetical protein